MNSEAYVLFYELVWPKNYNRNIIDNNENKNKKENKVNELEKEIEMYDDENK
jgi:hypothetical protein